MYGQQHPPPPSGFGAGGQVVIVRHQSWQGDTVDEDQMAIIQHLGKNIACFACLDLTLGILQLFTPGLGWPGILSCVGALCGMVGGRKYRPCYIVVYLVLLLLKAMFFFLVIAFGPVHQRLTVVLFCVLNIIYNVYVFRLCSLFYTLLNVMTPHDLEALRQMDNQRNQGY
jgi:hypothetical protein